MWPTFVLVHSPLVGPSTWSPVADVLRDREISAVVPSLVGIADATAEYWQFIAARVADAVDRLEPEQPVVFVAHSTAGLFVPVLVDSSPRPVDACLFVDARIPSLQGSTTAPQEMRDFLRERVAADGRLPRWTDWWDQDEIAALFPPGELRAAVIEEQPRLPLSYWEQAVPVPVAWSRPCGYLWFGAPYDSAAADARERGWLVEHLPGGHLHQIVEPAAVADRLLDMTARLRRRAGSDDR